MTQEDKDLLIKDLCCRLLYGVKCLVNYTFCNETTDYEDVKSSTVDTLIIINQQTESYFFEWLCEWFDIDEFKPYLFPLSSMTDEQKEELFKLCEFYIHEDWEGKKSEILGIEIASRPDPIYCYDHTFRMWNVDMRAINWLLKNHFDIYGLIPKGLAIDATNLNIY